jgi:hypothetical protein
MVVRCGVVNLLPGPAVPVSCASTVSRLQLHFQVDACNTGVESSCAVYACCSRQWCGAAVAVKREAVGNQLTRSLLGLQGWGKWGWGGGSGGLVGAGWGVWRSSCCGRHVVLHVAAHLMMSGACIFACI